MAKGPKDPDAHLDQAGIYSPTIDLLDIEHLENLWTTWIMFMSWKIERNMPPSLRAHLNIQNRVFLFRWFFPGTSLGLQVACWNLEGQM